ncbi:zinc transporter 6-like [Halichondria panicea]|uniref:zinc transporter 6-like n=1 Tax=Halichondria panicea TaxID=6063 RepID=UPI00312B9541
MDIKDLLISPFKDKKSLHVFVLLLLVLPLTCLLFYWCHTTNSLALSSFAYLTLFNVGSLLTCMVSVWVTKQKPTPKFSYGFARVDVLAVFSISILLILFSTNLIKHSMERIFDPPPVGTEKMLLGMFVGVFIHFLVTFGVSNLPLRHTTEAAPSNWFQRALHDLCHSELSPRQLRYSKPNPLNLLALGGAATVLLTQLLIDLDELYLADVAGSLFICTLICGTMLPLAIYSAKILLQTAPEHILPLLDKSLREASTLDGVLEIKNEHFWTVAYGSYAGSLHVRVRRDANEQEVLTQLTSRLASQLNDLTIQVVKEDLTLPSMPLSRGSTSSPNYTSRTLPPTDGKPPTASHVGQGKSPTPLTTFHAGQTVHKHSSPSTLEIIN